MTPFPHGARLCRHPRWGLCRAWSTDTQLHLAWDGGAVVTQQPGVRVASLAPWGARLLVALRSVRSDIEERVLSWAPDSSSWSKIAVFSSYSTVRWALPAGDTIIVRGDALTRWAPDGATEELGSAGDRAIVVGDRVATTIWDQRSGRRRIAVLGAQGPPDIPDAPAPSWDKLFPLDDGIAWLAAEGLVHWAPRCGARVLHPDPGPFLAGVWRVAGRLVWLEPEHTQGPGRLRAADGGALALRGGIQPLWPTRRGRWLVRRPEAHRAQQERFDVAELLRAAAQGAQLVEQELVLPVGSETPPPPRATRGPVALSDQPVTALEVHPAVHAACATLGRATLGALSGTDRQELVAAVVAQGLSEARAARAVHSVVWILADMGLTLK